METWKKINFERIVIVLGALLFSGGLLLFAFLGVYNRYWADDWCYNADLRTLGIWGTLQGYFYIISYASNRFSLTLFSGLLYKLGVTGIQIMTPAVVLLWFGGLFWILDLLRHIWKRKIPVKLMFLGSASVIYYTIYTAPHLYQSMYWRSGLLPYTAPLVSSLWVMGIVISQFRREKISYPVLTVSGLLAFFTGGFSEAGCAFLVTILSVYIFVAYWIVWRRRRGSKQAVLVAVFALFGALLAMAVLISSPTSALRAARYGAPAGWMEFPGILLYHSYQFVRLSLLDYPLPHLVLFVQFALMAYLLQYRAKYPIRRRHLILLVVLALVAAFLLIAATFAPSAYIEQNPPAPRTRIITRFVMMLAVAIAAGGLGIGAAQTLPNRWLSLLSMFLLLLSFAYPVRSIGITAQKVNLYAYRAAVWDERDVAIRNAVENGMTQVDVYELDSAPVGNINDLKADEDHWINNCAERYYAIETISAGLPVPDDFRP